MKVLEDIEQSWAIQRSAMQLQRPRRAAVEKGVLQWLLDSHPRLFLLTQGWHLHHPLSEQLLKFYGLGTSPTSP